jgi:hypothetical protein
MDTTNYIVLYKYVATCFDHLHGHPQATRTHKTKDTIEHFILGQNEILTLIVAQCIQIKFKFI